MFVTGVAVVVRGRGRPTADLMPVNTRVLGKDVSWFLGAYAIAVGAAFLPADADLARIGVAVLLLSIYAIYVKGHLTATNEGGSDDLEPLKLHRLDRAHHRASPERPRLRVVSLQVLLALGLIIGGAVVFVDAVESLSTGLGISPLILALVIAPIATELPEKFNSVIWIRGGKDTLAMGNITGAMVFQSCIPTVIGLVFAASAWRVDTSSSLSVLAFASAGIAFLSTLAIFIPMWRGGRLLGRGLLVGGGFYVAYLALVIAMTAGAV
jgi:cation:H+ antiporter